MSESLEVLATKALLAKLDESDIPEKEFDELPKFLKKAIKKGIIADPPSLKLLMKLQTALVKTLNKRHDSWVTRYGDVLKLKALHKQHTIISPKEAKLNLAYLKEMSSKCAKSFQKYEKFEADLAYCAMSLDDTPDKDLESTYKELSSIIRKLIKVIEETGKVIKDLL